MIAFTRQLILPFGHDEVSLKCQLEKLTGRPLSLVVTDNSTSVLSVRKKSENTTVRLHRMFLCARTDILREVADFIKKGRCNSPLLRSFIRENSFLLKQKSPVKIKTRVAGENYCLKTIYESLNREYFNGRITSAITWGRGTATQRVKMRTLGSYRAETDTIRINPLLDRSSVPAYFLEFVVYHEMLHADIGIKKRNGRRSIHSREFRMHEKKFRHYHKAMEWEGKRFGTGRRRGKAEG